MPELASAKKAISNQYTNFILIVEGEKPETMDNRHQIIANNDGRG